VQNFHDFLAGLDLLEWRPAGYLDPGVLELLAEVGRAPQILWDFISSWDLGNLETRQLRCHETSTHYKWFVHYHDDLRYRIWLHQYKPAPERRSGYAEVPHNHRYSLASLILSGQFKQHFFDVVAGRLTEIPDECAAHSRGDVYSIDWHRVHKLSGVSDRTVTLVVESPVARHFSEAFYSESARPSLCPDFVELHPHLLKARSLTY
jgi:hypothetical protein